MGNSFGWDLGGGVVSYNVMVRTGDKDGRGVLVSDIKVEIQILIRRGRRRGAGGRPPLHFSKMGGIAPSPHF